MFGITTTHFAAVSDYSFDLFITADSPTSFLARNGDPRQIQSVAMEVINARLYATVRGYCADYLTAVFPRGQFGYLESMGSMGSTNNGRHGPYCIVDRSFRHVADILEEKTTNGLV